jgi:hypothetical protein
VGTHTKLGAGASTKLSQGEAAKSAGLSKHQQVQAVRIAKVPEQEFERLVESPKPPTLTDLAALGRRIGEHEHVNTTESKPRVVGGVTKPVRYTKPGKSAKLLKRKREPVYGGIEWARRYYLEQFAKLDRAGKDAEFEFIITEIKAMI